MPRDLEADDRAVRESVDRLVGAFAENRSDEYFGSFHPDCSFVFHTASRRLESTNEYRALWRRWVEDEGFEVLGCRTFDTRVQRWGDVAVVTHSVETRVRSSGEETTLRERETIVLARQDDGRWLGIHEHLSPLADGSEPATTA